MNENAVLGQMSSSIGRRLAQRVAIVSIIAIIALIVVMVQAFFDASRTAQTLLDSKGVDVAHASDEFIGGILRDLHATADALTESGSVDELFRRALMRSDVGLFELLLVSPDGRVQYARRRAALPDRTSVEQPWLPVVEAGDAYIGVVDYEAYGVPLVDIAYPVISQNGDFEGTLVARVDLTNLWDVIVSISVGERGYAYITDETGRLLFHPDVALVRAASSLPDFANKTPQALSESNMQVYPNSAGNNVVGLSQPLKSVGWYAVVEQPVIEVAIPFLQHSIFPVLIFVVLLVVVINIVGFTQRQIVTPLHELQTGVEVFGKGELGYQINVDAEGEFAALVDTMNSLATELSETIDSLERRVDERTRGLLAAAEVSRATTSMLDPNVLLRQTVMLVQDRFDLYYVGLFLLDDEEEYAVLRAGTGDAGQEMISSDHRLRLGGQTMIGQCVATGRARIASDVGDEPARFDNPLLPNTRSEMALPLRAHRRVIGAMSVQSERPSAFDEASILVMQTMADQVAVAIDNARLYARAQAALQDMEVIQRRYLGEAWTEFLQQKSVRGYEGSQSGVVTLGQETLPGVSQAVTSQRPVVLAEPDEDATESGVVVPIVFRDRALGALGFRVTEKRQWSDEQIAFMESIAEQFGQAAENLRLVDTTQRLAAREHTVGEISAHMRQSLDLDTVLKTAAAEIRQALDVPELSVRLTLPRANGSAVSDLTSKTAFTSEVDLIDS